MADAFESGGEGSVGDFFNSLSLQFDKLCEERHAAGQKEYGEFTFLGNDVIAMMLEELADTANYCRYQYIKLMMLQSMLVEKIGDQPQAVQNFGIGSFKGAGDVGWERP
jgi:hypothetical protein